MSPAESWARRLRRLLRRELAALFVVAALIGALAGYAALGFRLLSDGVALLIWGVREDLLPTAARTLSLWHVLFAPAIGGLVLGLLVRYLLPGPQPQGVPDVMRAAAHEGGRMPLASGLAAAFLSASSIGVGASVGREGPIVHFGAVLASAFTRRIGAGPLLGRTLLGCGAAAGIAAAFNAPVAGVFFALEVVVGHYGLGAFSPVVIAALVGTVVTRAHIGEVAAFALIPLSVRSLWEIPAFLGLGVLCGLVAILLIRGVDLVRELHARARIPDFLQPALGGLVVGALALVAPEVLGVGYEPVSRALLGGLGLAGGLLVATAKLVATCASLGSRFGGGVFSPSLVIGASLGHAFGLFAAQPFPDIASAPGVYATVGMGALAAAVLGAPVSTVIIVFELTGDYAVTLAVMGAVATANVITSHLFGESFFTWQLRRAGIDLDQRSEYALLRSRRVGELLREDHVAVARGTDLGTLWRILHDRHGPVFVVDGNGRLVGVVDFDDLFELALAPERDGPPVVDAVIEPADVVLTPDCDLARAVQLACESAHDALPVVASTGDPRLVGEVRLRDLLRAYDEAARVAREAEAGLP